MKQKHALWFLLAFACISGTAFSQTTLLGNNRPGAGPFLGWNALGVAGTLDVRNDFNNNINFSTALVQRMTILGQPGFNQGFVGVGVIAPSWRLEVADNISIIPNGAGQAYYRIFGSPVLHVFGSNNTCVGENNGLAITTGFSNTFVGNDAGRVTTFGIRNTFVGDDAGRANIGNGDNTFIGTQTGLVNTANGNTFVGSLSGISNTTGNANSFTGMQSGNANTTGFNNSFYGTQSGFNNLNGYRNTFIGVNSGLNNTIGYQNTFVGNNAGAANIGGALFAGSLNTFVGDNAGLVNTIGFGNAFFGDQSGVRNTTGDNNTFLGHHAGGNNTTGANNCYIGSHAAFQNVASTGTRNNYLGAQSGPIEIIGNDNQFIGWQAGFNNINGDRNVMIGSNTGNVLNADDNVFVGHNSGLFQTTGTNNTYIGTNSANNAAVVNLSNAAAIGASAIPRNSNQMILGNNFVNVGIGLSNDPTGPQDKLEINANAVNTSGLQFRQLTASSPVVLNQGNQGLLALDVNGKVIYVPGASVNYLQPCATNRPLVNDVEMDMANYNFVFRDYPGSTTGSVGIGINSCAPSAKLQVLQHTGTTNTIGTLLENSDDATAGNDAIALKAVESSTVTTGRRVAGWFEVDQAGISCTLPKYAINVPQCGGYISFGYPTPTVAGGSLLSVNGDVTSNGIMFANAFTVISDSRYKSNIVSINKDSALAKIRALNGVYYDWDIANNPTYNFRAGRQIGFIAQQIAPILPEAVIVDTNGFYRVDYDRFAPLLVNAVRQLDSMNTAKDNIINALRANDSIQDARLDAIEAQMVQCCNNNNENGNVNGNGNNRISNPANNGMNQLEVELTNPSAIILNQNVPNPFAEKTVITYFIPANVTEAQLLFYNDLGVVLKTVDIKEKGSGTLTVYSSNLSSGTYSYSLLADGKVVDTKRMVCTK